MLSKKNFSVLMSIYKKENPEYFDIAMYSIWDNQTLKPSEILLVEDGILTPELYSIIKKWKDKLDDILIIVPLKENVGFAKALNIGLDYCSSELIMRMDTDDISMPNRFNIQYQYMQDNKDISASGTYIEEFDQNNPEYKNILQLPIENDKIKKFVKLRSPICHPSSMLRKKDIIEIGGYPELRLGQDYALWSVLIARDYKVSNIPKVLLKLRTNSDFFKRRGWDSFKYEVKAMNIQYKENLINIFEYIGIFLLRATLRLSPVFMKKIAYKILRK